MRNYKATIKLCFKKPCSRHDREAVSPGGGELEKAWPLLNEMAKAGKNGSSNCIHNPALINQQKW